MALHPFRTFQRNQKGCMAGATLLAIISFLFLNVIIQLLGGRGGPGSQIETIAECRRFGNITSIELDRLQKEQDYLQRFIAVLYRNLADPADQEKKYALTPLEMFASQIAQQTPEELVNNWLIAHSIREEGLTPGWKDVTELLKELTGGHISDAVYNDTLKSIGISHQTIEYLLVRQIQVRQAWQRFALSVEAVTPATRWDWYQRLNRQVTIEAAVVSVDSLMDQVGEPTSAQLNDLFDKNKTKKYDPVSLDSGFIMPTELAFQYVVAEPTQELLDSITEEEVSAYYEESKDAQFRKPITPLPQLPQLPGMMPGGGALPFPTPGRSLLPTAPLPSAVPNPTMPKVDSDENMLEETVPDAPVPPKPADFEESPEEISAASKVLTRLVSYQADEAQRDKSQETGGLTPAALAPTVHTPDTLAPAALDNPPSESEPVDLSVLYRPFDEVKDQIRKDLAMDKAMDALPAIQEKMREYAVVYHEHFEQGKQAPPMPDLTGLAAERGLKLVTVPMGNVYAALRTNLARGLQERQQIVRIFRNPPLRFEGETFWGSEGQMVLYWIIDQKDEIRPEKLDDVREVVLKRWKEIEARILARNKAEELANEAKASGKPLAEVFAGRSDVLVVETEPFTWKTYSGLNPFAAVMQRIPPVLGEIREKGVVVGDSEIDNQWIVAPGSDFMEIVYSLQIGETSVVFNQPQTMAYVVRVTGSSPSSDALWEQFQRVPFLMYAYAGQPEMVSSAFEAWLDDLRSKTGFRWVNKPEARDKFQDSTR